jgi:hypothetical protein
MEVVVVERVHSHRRMLRRSWPEILGLSRSGQAADRLVLAPIRVSSKHQRRRAWQRAVGLAERAQPGRKELGAQVDRLLLEPETQSSQVAMEAAAADFK